MATRHHRVSGNQEVMARKLVKHGQETKENSLETSDKTPNVPFNNP